MLKSEYLKIPCDCEVTFLALTLLALTGKSSEYLNVSVRAHMEPSHWEDQPPKLQAGWYHTEGNTTCHFQCLLHIE